MISTVSVEALHSATYVEDYLDSVENLPDDVQRHLSRIREIDVQYRNYLRDVNAYYEQWLVNQPQNGTTTTAVAGGAEASVVTTAPLESSNSTKRTISRIQQSLIAAQELGDEKLQVVQQLQDLIDHRTRQLDQDFKNLGSDFFSRLDYGREDKMADAKEHSSLIPTSSSPHIVSAAGPVFAVSVSGGLNTSCSPGATTTAGGAATGTNTGNSSHSISGNGITIGGSSYKSTGPGDVGHNNSNSIANNSGSHSNAAGSNGNNTGSNVSGTSNNSNNNSNNNSGTGGNNSNTTPIGGASSGINPGSTSNSINSSINNNNSNNNSSSSININNNNTNSNNNINNNSNNNNSASCSNERSSKRARRTRNDASGMANGSNTPCLISGVPMDVDPSDMETGNVKQDVSVSSSNGGNGPNSGSTGGGSSSGSGGSGGSGTSSGSGNGNGGTSSSGNGSKVGANCQANSANPTGKKTAGSGKKKKRKAGGRGTASTREAREDTPPQEPIDPDEPTYCLCDQISFGEMILCDNDLCPIEWFHFSCVSLISKPKGKWFCPNCRGDRPNVMKPKAQFLKELERYNKEKEEKT